MCVNHIQKINAKGVVNEFEIYTELSIFKKKKNLLKSILETNFLEKDFKFLFLEVKQIGIGVKSCHDNQL